MRLQSVRSVLISSVLASLVVSSNCETQDNPQRFLLTLPPPRNLRVKVADKTEVVLEWDAPFRSARDLKIDGYAVAYNCTEDLEALGKPQLVSWRLVKTQAERSYTIKNLRPSTEYEFYLSAYGTHNGVLALSTSVSIRAYTGPLLVGLGYAFPVAAMLVIMILATVVYTRIQHNRRHGLTIQ